MQLTFLILGILLPDIEPKNEFSLNLEILVALFALIISGIGVFLAVRYNRRTLEMTMIHNKKSTEPMISSFYHYLKVENCEKLIIKNSGLGPAKITSIKFYFENKEYETYLKLIKEKFPGVYNNLKPSSRRLHLSSNEYHPFAKDEELELFNLEYNKEQKPEQWLKIAKNATFEVKYESIYEVQTPLKSKIYTGGS